MLLFSHADVNQSVWVESSASESFLWVPLSSVTSGVQSLLSKRRAAFMCSLAAEIKQLPHGPVQFHAQLMLLKLMDLGEVILHQVAPDYENSKGFSKSENKRLHMLSLCKINFKIIASSWKQISSSVYM